MVVTRWTKAIVIGLKFGSLAMKSRRGKAMRDESGKARRSIILLRAIGIGFCLCAPAREWLQALCATRRRP